MKQPDRERGRWGTFLVAFGASLWASDLILRRGLAQELPAIEIVFWEHLILTIACLPFLIRARRYLRAFGLREWVAAILVGAGASVAATVLFTAAFARGDATSVLLLQKLQPLVVVLAAHIMLGERLTPRYTLFAVPALAGSYLLSFPDPLDVRVEQVAAAGLSVSAAVLWGLGTVLGRQLSFKIPHLEQAALRFTVGLPVAALLLALAARSGPAVIAQAGEAPTLIALALIPGLLAMSLY
ncbi:MAG: EamA family transporter, partial [Actinobacteria bacterium]|nr:EamA family transporter [Actinomycetota bacterium]